LLKFRRARQRGFLQTPAKAAAKGRPVGNQPRFHARRHKEYLFVGRASRSLPIVAFKQVVPWAIRVFDRVFAIDKHPKEDRIPLDLSVAERLEGLISASAGANPGELSGGHETFQ